MARIRTRKARNDDERERISAVARAVMEAEPAELHKVLPGDAVIVDPAYGVNDLLEVVRGELYCGHGWSFQKGWGAPGSSTTTRRAARTLRTASAPGKPAYQRVERLKAQGMLSGASRKTAV